MPTETLVRYFYTIPMFFFIAGLVLLDEKNPNGIWLLLAAPIGAAIVYFIAGMLRKREGQREEKVEAELQNELAKMQHAGYTFCVRGGPRFIAPALMALFGILLLRGSQQNHNLVFVVMAWPLLIAAALTGWQSFLLFGESIVTFSKRGFDTPVHGHIPWSAVYGIDVGEDTYKGNVIRYILRLYVPSLSTYTPQFAFPEQLIYRLLFWRRKIVLITLKNGGDDPDTVERITKELWLAATGRNYLWDPDASDAANAEARRDADAEPATAVPDVSELPHPAVDSAPFTGNVDLAEKNRERIASEWHWIFIASVALIALALLAKFLKHLF